MNAPEEKEEEVWKRKCMQLRIKERGGLEEQMDAPEEKQEGIWKRE